jgi:hypothetical protein
VRHTTDRKSSSKTSFIQAVLLLVFLIVGFLGYKILKQGDITSGLNSMVNMDVQGMRQLQAMDDTTKKTLQKTFGGFWVYKTEDSLSPVQKNDCLELRDNGIIWQVIHWRVKYPSGDTESFYHVRYGYLNPSNTTNNSDNIVCEVRTIRQIFIHDGDTCFGTSQVDELWQARKNDTVLNLNRKKYTPYHGELTIFFPDGMIDLINKVVINDCRRNLTSGAIIKENLNNYYQNTDTKKTNDTRIIKQSLSDYFKAAYVDEIFSALPYFPVLPDSIVVPIACTERGRLEVTLSKNETARLHHFEKIVINELATWPVPPTIGNTPVKMKYSIKLPVP